jgi:hypothetical protein
MSQTCWVNEKEILVQRPTSKYKLLITILWNSCEEIEVRSVLVANPAEMRPLGRFSHRWSANIKMDFKEQRYFGMDSSGTSTVDHWRVFALHKMRAG